MPTLIVILLSINCVVIYIRLIPLFPSEPGTLENDLLLASFAHKHLPTMNAEELDKYDYLINTISNEWDIYYWAVGVKEVPEEYRNSIMTKFIEHVKNENREQRFRQPELWLSVAVEVGVSQSGHYVYFKL